MGLCSPSLVLLKSTISYKRAEHCIFRLKILRDVVTWPALQEQYGGTIYRFIYCTFEDMVSIVFLHDGFDCSAQELQRVL